MCDHHIPEYGWKDAEATCAHAYLLSGIEKALDDWMGVAKQKDRKFRLFDAGCGNGYLASVFAEKGFEVAGCDSSNEGIDQARKLCPGARFELCSVYDSMLDKLGGWWDIVISSEVIEHLYDPGRLIENVYPMLLPGGIFIITTPYHGYLKNLMMAVTGKLDNHFTALWDGGHIKFWSYKTLASFLDKKGFSVENFYGAGRLPWLWKSMIISAIKTR